MITVANLFIIAVITFVCVSSESVVKFKDDHNSVYFYSLKRHAYNPDKNTSEICSCDIELQKYPNDPTKVIANLTIIEQVFHKINRPSSTPQELMQIQTPFIAVVTENGDLSSIITEENESHRSLEIKNQVVQTLMLNKTLYKSFIDGNENDFLIEVDLSTHLPLFLCNASVHVDRLPDEYKIRLYVNANKCWELVVGNVRLTNNSQYEVVTTFEKDGLNLKELKENTVIEIEITTDGRRAKSTYEFYLKFKEFVNGHKQNTEKLTEIHGQEKLDNIILY